MFLVADPEGLGGRHGGCFVDHEGTGFLPKLIVGGAHFFDDFGVLSGDVGFLAGIFAHVVELLVNEAVLMIANGEAGPLVFVRLGAGGPASLLGKQVAVGPLDLGIAEKGEETTAADLVSRAGGGGKRGEGGKEIDVGDDVRDVAARFEGAFPAEEEGDADAAFIGASFEAFLSGVEHHHGLAVLGFSQRLLGASGTSSGHAVVGHKDEDGVFFEAPLGEFVHETAHIFVDIFDHAIEAGVLGREAEIGEALGV